MKLEKLKYKARQRTALQAPASWRDWLPALFPNLFYYPFVERHEQFWNHIQAIKPGVKPPAFFAIWARGGTKTTNAEGAAVYVGATERRKFVLYVRSIQDKANESVSNIADMLEGPEVARYYPLLAQRKLSKYGHSKGWKINVLRCASGFNVVALGLNAAVRGAKLEGFRPDFIIGDDLDEKDDTYESTIKKIHTLTRDILPSGSPDAAFVGIQNLVNYNGIFTQIARNRADFLYDRIVGGPHPAVIDLEYEKDENGRYRITGGQPTWPGQDLATCEAQMNEWGLSAFLHEAQHLITKREGRVYHAFTGPGPDAATLDYSKAAGYWHSHDFGAVNAVWGLWCRIENVYYLIWEQQLPEGTTASRAAIIKARLDGKNVVAGFGGAKGEEQQRLDFLREGVKIRLPVITDVEGQVDAANRMLESGTMVICSNCVHTIDQMENCVRDEKEGIAEKSTWHYCFVAGTLISTSEGLKPIEQMRVGDLVKTRKGYRRVTATGFRSNEQVITVRFSNGLQLTGTLDHPIFVQNVPTRLDVLRYGDIISLDKNYFKELYQWLQKTEKPLNFKEKPIIDTLMREIYQTEDTLGIKVSTFIELFGNRIMAQFRKAIRFTTRIETRPITTLVTWQWLKQVSTSGNITSQRASDLNGLDKGLTRLDPLRLNGINQRRAESGIASNQKRIGSIRTSVDKSSNQDNIPVSIVGGYSTVEAYRLIKSSFARMGASHLTVESPVLITKQESVLSASNPLLPTSTVELDFAHVAVLTRLGLANVYNLTVEGEHEYFANGVLVANCDMTRYFAAGVKRGVFVG